MSVVEITVDNFDEEVLKESKPVLIDFWASWCGPCKMLSPIVDGLAEELTDVKICKVNIDEQSALAEKYHVMTIPTLIVLKDGKLVKSSIGVQSKSFIIDMLKIA